MARKSKLSPTLINSICEGIEKGNYVTTICKSLQIHEETYYGWLREAKTKSPQSLQYKLKQRVEESEAKSEENAVRAWVNHFDTDWRAPKEFLARRHIAPNIKLLEDKEDS